MRTCLLSAALVVFLTSRIVGVDCKIACPALRIKNGRARYRQRGGFVQSSCNPGFILAGDKYMKCSKGAWEGVVPVCVRDSCKPFKTPDNGYVYASHRQAVLNFFCKAGHQLIGPATAFCDGNNWSTHLPVCAVSNQTVSISCDFESDDICGWTHDLNHNFDWIRHTGPTPSAFIGTGPPNDHTLGSGKKGHYMYVEASAKNPRDMARLISPVHNAQENKSCLVFWYHMYGSSMGELRVYQRAVSKQDWAFDAKDAAWRRAGEQGFRWLKGEVELDPIGEDFQVVFEAVRGGNYMSDTAIDDVSLVDCSTLEENEITTTTEETSVSNVDTWVGWTCNNLCGSNPPGDYCSCTSDCFEQMSCCPDYEAYCIDFDTSTDATETTWVDDPTTLNLINDIATIPEDKHNDEGEVVDLTLSTTPSTTTSMRTPTTRRPTTTRRRPTTTTRRPTTTTRRPTTTTRRTTTSTTTPRPKPTSPRLLPPPKVIPSNTTRTTPRKVVNQFTPPPSLLPPNLDPRFAPPKQAVPPATTPKKKGEDGPKKPEQTDNEVLRASQPNNDKLSNHEKGTVSTMTIIGLSGLLALIGILLVVKLRRRVARSCDVMRMRRGGSGDSQSDVRFLTSDEVLDFSLASSTL